jgi:hypothetical protein
MNRNLVYIFSGVLFLISLLGFSNPANSFQWLLGANPTFDVLRIAAAIILLACATVSALQSRLGILILKIVGIASIGFVIGLFTLGSSNGMAQLLPLDIFGFLEIGIISLLLSYQLEDEISPELILKSNTSKSVTSSKPAKKIKQLLPAT